MSSVRRKLLIAGALVILASSACSDVPPSPAVGDGGSGGDGTGGGEGPGGFGGRSDAGGSSGTGGSVGCTEVVPMEAMFVETGEDQVQGASAIGTVCDSGCSRGPTDLLDRWSFRACGGKHTAVLQWDTPSADLQLELRTADGTLIAESLGPPLVDDEDDLIRFREVSGDLLRDAFYQIDVRPEDTGGLPLPYVVRIRRD